MIRLVGVILSLCAWPAIARAHSTLTEPPGRSSDDSLTEGPCGGVPAADPVTIDAGSTIDLRWVATQSHANEYRIAFSPDGIGGFDDGVIGTVPDIGAQEYTQAVPMPDCICDACAIQLAQFTVTGKVAYYSCADIRLVGDGLPTCTVMTGGETTSGGEADTSGDAATSSGEIGSSSSSSDGGTAVDASTDESTTGSVEPASTSTAQGCACAAGDRHATAPLGLVLLGAAIRRRRRRAPPAARASGC